MRIVLYLVFVLSGAAGLIYESIWSRYLGLFVGHSAYAQIIVLAMFLGGMSLGALAVGQRSEPLRAPLVWYAGVELAVGLLGGMFHLVYGAVTHAAYAVVLPVLSGTTAVLMAKWTIASVLIKPLRVLAWVQWLMGCMALLTLPIYLASFHWMSRFIAMFGQTDAGYVGFTLARYGLCLAVMLPATFCAGITLPLITRMLLLSGQGERAR